MRTAYFCIVFALSNVCVMAQNSAAVPKLFTSAGDVSALIAKAKSERKPDQANYLQPLVQFAPYTASLEYRVAGLKANAAVHENEVEMFYVVEGSGTLVIGGKLADKSIDGGESRRVAKGDFFIVPPNTPHMFTVAEGAEGALVLMSIHLPK